MKKSSALPALFVLPLLVAFSEAAEAAPRAPGLGVGVGLAVPRSSGEFELKPSFNWGFYVDIPLLSSFYITPSTTLYNVKPKTAEGSTETVADRSATDVSLNFKFVIPISIVEIYAGVTAGVTSDGDLNPHLGALGGISINVVSNLDLFVNANYRFTFIEDANLQNVQIFAGPLIRFDY